MPTRADLNKVIELAIADFAEHGYDDPTRLERWLRAIRDAAAGALVPEQALAEMLRGSLANVFRRLVDRGGIEKFHQGVERYAIERLRPALRLELDRRMLAAADLIKLNREQAIRETLRRFAGWATSVPRGGAAGVRRTARDRVRKALASLPFEERRVLIDQGHKLRASISEIVAVDGGAIAGRWKSHWRQVGYDYREEHKERDDRVFLLRSSWARDRGLVRPGPAGFVDDVTRPGEEVYCRCWYEWIHALSRMPPEMLTSKGRATAAASRTAA